MNIAILLTVIALLVSLVITIYAYRKDLIRSRGYYGRGYRLLDLIKNNSTSRDTDTKRNVSIGLTILFIILIGVILACRHENRVSFYSHMNIRESYISLLNNDSSEYNKDSVYEAIIEFNSVILGNQYRQGIDVNSILYPSDCDWNDIELIYGVPEQE